MDMDLHVQYGERMATKPIDRRLRQAAERYRKHRTTAESSHAELVALMQLAAKEGMSRRQVAAVTGLSPSRVQQLTTGGS